MKFDRFGYAVPQLRQFRIVVRIPAVSTGWVSDYVDQTVEDFNKVLAAKGCNRVAVLEGSK